MCLYECKCKHNQLFYVYIFGVLAAASYLGRGDFYICQLFETIFPKVHAEGTWFYFCLTSAGVLHHQVERPLRLDHLKKLD